MSDPGRAAPPHPPTGIGPARGEVTLPDTADVDALRSSLDEIRRLLDGVCAGSAAGRGPATADSGQGRAPRDADHGRPPRTTDRGEGAAAVLPPSAATVPPDDEVDLFAPVRRPPLPGREPDVEDGADPALVPPASKAGRRLLAVAVLLLAVGLGVAAAVRLASSAGSSGPSSAPRPSSPTTVSAQSATGASLTAWPGSTDGRPAGLVTSGPGVDRPGTDVVVAPGAPGTLEVYERIVPASRAVIGLQLPAPDLAAARLLTVGRSLAVSGLTATVNGGPAQVEDRAGSWLVSDPRGVPVRTAALRYRLTGAVVRDEPAVPGRALALVTPLSAHLSLAAGAPVLVHVDRAVVHEAHCPLAAADQQLCGTLTRTGWVARIPAGSAVALVTLQIDLAPASR